eukprot:CAMPEP_0185017834 /NCGR_PEP_ID=MMETSP1103-20130426/712_1 /TAXON_ID=36769 /ORGANISM="Paraphysomonas bandaiensis, Strain Caron Lab Isolate" /LENGTH=375 /DNA_ID=CAMNT_0027547419 /DNA_START=591 /DNA_END=1718 /DNA_ORIENTATION=+
MSNSAPPINVVCNVKKIVGPSGLVRRSADIDLSMVESLTSFKSKIVSFHEDEKAVTSLRCVEFANAPQCHDTLRGKCKLFITRNEGMVQGDSECYRLHFHSSEEVPENISKHTFRNKSGWKYTCFASSCKCVRWEGRLETVEVDDVVRRDASGAFVSIRLTDVCAVHYEENDFSELHSMLSNMKDPVKEEHEIALCPCSCPCPCSLWSCFSALLTCCGLCSLCKCECKLSDMKDVIETWEFSTKKLKNLRNLYGGEKFSKERVESKLHNPIRAVEETVRVTATETAKWQRKHCIHITYLDALDTNKKHRGIIVLDPEEDSQACIDFVCAMNDILDQQLADMSTETMAMIRNMPLEPPHKPSIISNFTFHGLSNIF